MYKRRSDRTGRERFRARKLKACVFCEKKTTPDYKDMGALRSYLSERGKIAPYYRTGLCAKHQRLLSMAIKRARFLALIPFVV